LLCHTKWKFKQQKKQKNDKAKKMNKKKAKAMQKQQQKHWKQFLFNLENDENQKQYSEGWEMKKEFDVSLQKFSSQEYIKQMTELNAELSQIPALGPHVGTMEIKNSYIMLFEIINRKIYHLNKTFPSKYRISIKVIDDFINNHPEISMEKPSHETYFSHANIFLITLNAEPSGYGQLPLLLVQIRNKVKFNCPDIDVLKSYLKTLGDIYGGLHNKLYGMLVDNTSIKFVKYQNQCYSETDILPFSLKKLIEPENHPESMKEYIKLIICMIEDELINLKACSKYNWEL